MRFGLRASVRILLPVIGLAVAPLLLTAGNDASAQTNSSNRPTFPAAGSNLARQPFNAGPAQRFRGTAINGPDEPTKPNRPKKPGKPKVSQTTDGGRNPGGKDGSRPPRGPRYPGGPGIGVGVPVAPVAPAIGIAQPPSFGGGGVPPTIRQAQPARRTGSGVPPANERRYIPDEVVIEVGSLLSAQAADALARRHRLTRLESVPFQLTGTTLIRLRITDRRSVPTVIRGVETEQAVLAAQPNYRAVLQQEAQPAAGVDPAQYAPAKLRLPQAHALAKGERILIAVIDSGIDGGHPELAGAIAGRFDALGTDDAPHAHGTGIAGAMAARAKLMGAAPAAQILAVRAFTTNEGTTFNILKGLDWAAANGARIINMSFAGPKDPAVGRSLAAARGKGIVLIAAAGNAGPRSAPLYPAADPNVIAVTATDADDKLFAPANRGRHIAVAAPGVDLLLPALDGTYQVTSGTSFAAAEVSGAVALLLERRPDLDPEAVRRTLAATARDLGSKGVDSEFGAGLVDAYQAVLATEPPAASAAQVVPAQVVPGQVVPAAGTR
jgi:subtilisin family serine protease